MKSHEPMDGFLETSVRSERCAIRAAWGPLSTLPNVGFSYNCTGMGIVQATDSAATLTLQAEARGKSQRREADGENLPGNS